MGNSESSSNSSNNSLKRSSFRGVRDFSPSPLHESHHGTPRRHPNMRSASIGHHHSRKLSSFRGAASDHGLNIRGRSFRAPPAKPASPQSAKKSLTAAVCQTTGLTVQQKHRLINCYRQVLKTIRIVTLLQLPRAVAYAIGELVFGQLFSRSPEHLQALTLEHLIGTDDWRRDITFRVHCQQFSQLLGNTMRHLQEPLAAADRLQEFGAEYAELEIGKPRIRNGYWEMLTSALTATAIQVHDGGNDNNNEMATAWATLAQFLVNQIRFGYNMEHMLQGEMRKLGLQGRSGSGSTSNNSRRTSGIRL